VLPLLHHPLVLPCIFAPIVYAADAALVMALEPVHGVAAEAQRGDSIGMLSPNHVTKPYG
jgi:hypothetical protein